MHRYDNYSRVMGILCSMALISVYCVSAMAMQSLKQGTALVSGDSSQPNGSQGNSKASVFTGTIIKNGSYIVLRDSSGTIYRLDAPEKAAPFEGKSVTVTGKLVPSTNLIHIESIGALAA